MVGIREGNENTWSIRSSDVKIDLDLETGRELFMEGRGEC